MKTAYKALIVTFVTIAPVFALGQNIFVKKYLKEQDEVARKNFPPILTSPFVNNSLAEKLQEAYKSQALTACLINRSDNRLYIPQDVINGYGEAKLRKTIVYELPMSATNLLFLTLKNADIDKLTKGNFAETEYINAKRILGINDNLVDFGLSSVAPIGGFPSLYYQKSCGSYFTGNISASISAPVAELKSSLEAETKKESSITTITGKFFSPLYLIFDQQTPQSVYAHLLLWQIYYNDYSTVVNKNDALIKSGQYISEFDGTLLYRAINSEQSINMNGRLSANISAGIFNVAGNVQTGHDNKISFSLKDFKTYIHKLQSDKLSYALTDLPKAGKINQKLQSSFFKSQPSITGYVTHLIPTEISRIMTGIPEFLCGSSSWGIEDHDFDSNIWVSKPTVVSFYNKEKDNYPDCICKITGLIKKEAIDRANHNNRVLTLTMKLTSNIKIDDNSLTFEVKEPVKVTDDPKVLPINNETINAKREEITRSSTNKKFYQFPVEFFINDNDVRLKRPFQISGLQIEYINSDQTVLSLSSTNSQVNGNSISLNVKTDEKPFDYVIESEQNVPIKLKFFVALENGTPTQLVTNIINLSVPNLAKHKTLESKVPNQ